MPWIIERDGSTLRLQIACPIDDWEILFEEIERRLGVEQDVTAIELPEKIPGASRIDADVLVVLRRVLAHTSGVSVLTTSWPAAPLWAGASGRSELRAVRGP
jgi:hypothetical protein